MMELEPGGRLFTDCRRALIRSKSPHSAVHLERDGFKPTLTYGVECGPEARHTFSKYLQTSLFF